MKISGGTTPEVSFLPVARKQERKFRYCFEYY
jgi:hypothetical protein